MKKFFEEPAVECVKICSEVITDDVLKPEFGETSTDMPFPGGN